MALALRWAFYAVKTFQLIRILSSLEYAATFCQATIELTNYATVLQQYTKKHVANQSGDD